MRHPKRFYIKKRYNPQLGVYYVACGEMTKTAAKKLVTNGLYGSNRMLGFDSEAAYLSELTQLETRGESVQR